MPRIFLLFILLFITSCNQKLTYFANYETESLKIVPLTQNSYIHVSYLNIPGSGSFPCNGLVLIDDGKAVIFDTPANAAASDELINLLQKDLEIKIIAVVINHFHNDCLAGLKLFHDKGITSYGNNRTINLAANQERFDIPQEGFEDVMEISFGKQKVVNVFFGEGHSPDNIISYLPMEGVVFGGCLIKESGAGKGNLADANIDQWPVTVTKIREAYPEIEFVVPGHGKPGGPELFDYTIELFTEKN